MDTATDITLIQLLIMIIDGNNAVHVSLTVDICQEVNRWMFAVGITECSYMDLAGITCYILGFYDIWLTASGTKAGSKDKGSEGALLSLMQLTFPVD